MFIGRPKGETPEVTRFRWSRRQASVDLGGSLGTTTLSRRDDEQVAREDPGCSPLAVRHHLVCVGETLAERDGGRTEPVLIRQVGAVLHALQPDDWSRVVLAYEPVWAIGTGKNATPDDAAQIHELIRMELGRNQVNSHVSILYGGSVNPENVALLLTRPQIDGVLVGGASLDPNVGHPDRKRIQGQSAPVRRLRCSRGIGLP